MKGVPFLNKRNIKGVPIKGSKVGIPPPPGRKHLPKRNTACVGLWYSTNPPRIRNPLNSSKFVSAVPAMIYRPVWNQHTRNMKSRLAIKFPSPCEYQSNALPLGQKEASNAQGMPRGMFNLRFDWYIILHSVA